MIFIDCGCNREGSTSLICNKTDGQCACKPNVHGRQYDKCKDGFKLHPNCTGTSFDVCIFLLTNLMYSACGCDTQGSNGTACSNDGQCRCKANIEGLTCNHCIDEFYSFPTCQGISTKKSSFSRL